MRVLLFAMPDTVDWLDHIMRVPALSIVSLAGCLREHEVHVLDLVTCKENVKPALDRHLNELRPEIVGLSAMTAQYDSAQKIARYVRNWDPTVKVVLGGYHATLMSEEITSSGPDLPFDFIVRGEGEVAMPELVDALASGNDASGIKGVSYRDGDVWHHNDRADVLDLTKVPLPDRSARLADRFLAFSSIVDVCETSRGCPLNCNFCSIRGMYGSTSRTYPIERVMADLRAIQDLGKDMIFFADDNIGYDVEHFKRVCEAIIAEGLNSMEYSVQVSAMSMAKNPDLVALMDRANIRVVHLGLESMDEAALRFMRKATSAELNAQAVAVLKKHNIGINALFIVGFPDDDVASIKRSFKTLTALGPDAIYCQFMTPYPKTDVREELLKAGLVVNKDDFTKYNGFHCNVKTKHLSRDELWSISSRENLKTIPSLLMGGNYFLRRYFFSFLWCELKVIVTAVFKLVTGRSGKWRLDL